MEIKKKSRRQIDEEEEEEQEALRRKKALLQDKHDRVHREESGGHEARKKEGRQHRS